MKHDETRGRSGEDASPSVDTEEVRRRAVLAFAQMVGDAMSADWTRQSLEATQSAAADEAQGRPADSTQDGLGFFPLPSPERHRSVTADEVPVIGVGTFSPGQEQAPATLPYLFRRRMIQPSGFVGSPYRMLRPQVSLRIRRMISDLYGADVSSPLDDDYRPLANPWPFGDAEVTTIGVQPTEIDPLSFGLLSANRRRLSSLFPGDLYGVPRSLWDIIPPRDLESLRVFPRSMNPNNNQEVENDDDNGTSEVPLGPFASGTQDVGGHWIQLVGYGAKAQASSLKWNGAAAGCDVED